MKMDAGFSLNGKQLNLNFLTHHNIGLIYVGYVMYRGYRTCGKQPGYLNTSHCSPLS